jgi:hypothetical protein
MPKTIILEYPDNAPYERIVDDIQRIVRGVGGKVASPAVLVDDQDPAVAELIPLLKRQGFQASAGGGGTSVGADQYLLTNGVATQCGTDTLTFTIAGGVITDYQVTGGS